jgi:F-type H+-transporting ATPase subunit O
LFTAASKAGLLTKVEGELQAFNKAVSSSPAFSLFLKNPTISRREKANVLSGVLDDKFSHITRNLFVMLAANGRIAEADKVIADYLDLMETVSGVVKAVVISAEPLQGKTLKSVQTAVMDMVEKGKKVEVEVKVDPSIIGGLQVIIGDRFLDLSVANRISTLGQALEGADA